MDHKMGDQKRSQTAEKIDTLQNLVHGLSIGNCALHLFVLVVEVIFTLYHKSKCWEKQRNLFANFWLFFHTECTIGIATSILTAITMLYFEPTKKKKMIMIPSIAAQSLLTICLLTLLFVYLKIITGGECIDRNPIIYICLIFLIYLLIISFWLLQSMLSLFILIGSDTVDNPNSDENGVEASFYGSFLNLSRS